MEQFIINIKKGHTKSIISCDFNTNNNEIIDDNIFATNSEDKNIRIWDLRKKNCSKIIINKLLTENMSNIIFKDNFIYIGCEKEIFVFDLRIDKIINKDYLVRENIYNEEISTLKFCNNDKNLFFSDDGGTLGYFSIKKEKIDKIYDPNKLLNINLGLAAIENKNDIYNIYSGGFDEMISKFKFDINRENKKFDEKINSSDANSEDFFEKDNISFSENFLLLNRLNVMEYYKNFPNIMQKNTKPFIYDIEYGNVDNDLLLSLENGNVISIKSKQYTKPRFIIEGHLNKVIKSEYSKFRKDLIISLSEDLNIGLWNSKNQNLIKKLKISEYPNYFRSSKNNNIILCDTSKELKIINIK